MKLVIACLVVTTSLARADDDPGMQLMTVMLRCPAISSDGKHVAIYGSDPGTEKDAMTSLAIFGPAGTVETRISVVPPNTDKTRAKAAAAKLVKLLDDGGYKRMSRVARVSEKLDKTKFSTHLTSEDIALDVQLADRKLTITGTRRGEHLVPHSLTLGATDGPCKKVTAYGLANTMAGFDPKTGLFAFSIDAEENATVCFAHAFVVTLE
jgi:hypothetical protein